MKVDLFDFDLPAEAIAQHPARPRDSARLLMVDPNADPLLSDHGVSDLAALLTPADILVFNDTRVIPARLKGRSGEARIEVTLHKREDDATWVAFARPAKKLKPGKDVTFADGLTATVIARGEGDRGGEVTLRFNTSGPDLMAALKDTGEMPLPPYIKRAEADAHDLDDYQTLFAAREGAVAAPTASLHFTPAMMETIAARGIKTAILTLHVGAGTFLPVKADDTDDHVMHAEWAELTPATANAINDARANGGRVVAVGTTALRTLETAADETGIVHPFVGETDIFITPGYRFKITDMLMTNFHLPKSTLFMLVSAFSGLDEMKQAYAHAITTGYRFYSYGDGSLLHRKDVP